MVEALMTPEQSTWILAHHERPDGRGYPRGLLVGQQFTAEAVAALETALVAR